MQLRDSTDVKRLFSALGDTDDYLDINVDDLVQVDEQILVANDIQGLAEVDSGALTLSILVALASGWVAIRGYERHNRSIGWGLTWAAFGFLMPLPALAVSAFQQDS